MIAVILLVQALTIAVSGPPTSPEYLPVHVAAAEGYFTEQGLTVTLRLARSEADAAEALRDNTADLAATSLASVLRFVGVVKGATARLVFGLSAAPPVVLAVSPSAANTVRTLADLSGSAVGMAYPGAPEQIWFLALLARNRLAPTRVAIVTYGEREVATALEEDRLRAALLRDPYASRLLAGGRARAFADFRDPHSVGQTLGRSTVNAALFARGRSRLSASDLESVCRALLKAVARVESAPAAELAGRLPRPVVGFPEEFPLRLGAARKLYLDRGLVEPDTLEDSVQMIRALVPLRRRPGAAELLDLGPLRRALSLDRSR